MHVSREFPRSIDALDGLFAFVDEQLPEGLSEKVLLHVNLAVEELFTNMVRHNEPGGAQIDVQVAVDAERVRVQLADYDVQPWDPETVASASVDRPLSERQAGGLGIHLVKSVVDRLVYEYDDRVMRVTFSKDLKASDVRD